MASSTRRHRDSRDEGNSNRVVMVAQRSHSDRKRDKKKNVAGRMWDSFESESPSSEEGDPDAKKALERRRASNNGSSANSLRSERSSRAGKNRRRASADGIKGSPLREAEGGEQTTSELYGTEDHSVSSKSHSAVSSSAHKKSSRSKVRAGDKVVVYLPSGGKAKGTILVETSRDRYEVTLENGEVEKRVHSRNIALVRRHRKHHRNRDSVRRRSSSGHSPKNDDSPPRQQESREGALDRRQHSHGDLSSESDSQAAARQSASDPSAAATAAAVASPSGSSAEVQMQHGPGGDRPGSPLSQVQSTATSAASGGGDPAQQPPAAASNSPDTAPTGQIPAHIEAHAASESEPETSNGERGSSSERTPSPLSNKVRQAQGLLKTMFWKKGEEQSGSSVERSRRWSRGGSISRRFSKDSSGGGGLKDARGSRSAPPGGNKDAREEDDAAVKLDPPTPTSELSEDPASTPLGAAALKGHARRLSQGLARGRSRSRKEAARQSAASGSPASRSPSLAVKLGMTLRGAIMGKTELGVHRPHADLQSPGCGPPGSDAEDAAASDATYSTGASAKAKLLLARSKRRGSGGRRRSCAADEEEHRGGGGHSSDGFDSDVFGQDSPLAPTAFGGGGGGGGDPTNFPDAVYSYIGARERMEHEMSASGPAFLPCVDSLAASTAVDGANKVWAKKRGSLDITKQASSTTQRTEQHQPFTEAMFKAGISETRHSTKQGILLEGDLQKFSPESMRGVRWHKRYFVLYACSCELRYYRTHAEAAWGRIPLGERGSIPLRLVVKIEQPSDKKYRGCRFDLVVLHRGDGRHPGLHIRPGQESRVLTTKTFKFNAADAQQRLLWVTVIEALMKKHGWGADADRRRRGSMPAPRYGDPGGADADAAGDSLGWASTWDREAAGTEPVRQPAVPGRLGDGGKSNAAALEEFSSPNMMDGNQRLHGRQPGVDSATRGSVMTFVEEPAGIGDLNPFQQKNDGETLASLRGTTTSTSAPQQRGLRIPYSPGGKRGSLTTGSLALPVTASRGATAQTSLKSDLRY